MHSEKLKKEKEAAAKAKKKGKAGGSLRMDTNKVNDLLYSYMSGQQPLKK